MKSNPNIKNAKSHRFKATNYIITITKLSIPKAASSIELP